MSDPITTKQKRAGGEAGKWLGATFEWLGILNKGSSTSPATPTAEEAATTAGVNTNSLNVTRVGGVGAFVASVGAAAIAIFSVDKGKDPPIVVMAAYISVGVIVAAALVTVGLIITADIRSRVSLSATASPSFAGTQMTTPATPATPASGTAPSSAGPLVAAWRQAVADLDRVVDRLQSPQHKMTDAWLDASASAGIVVDLKPSTEQQLLHARLQAGHSLFVDRLKKLIDESDAGKRTAALAGLRELVVSMGRSLQDWV